MRFIVLLDEVDCHKQSVINANSGREREQQISKMQAQINLPERSHVRHSSSSLSSLCYRCHYSLVVGHQQPHR